MYCLFKYIMLQAPYNTLEYDIIGDDSAPTFFRIDAVTGNIFMRDTISNDVTDTYYVRDLLVLVHVFSQLLC